MAIDKLHNITPRIHTTHIRYCQRHLLRSMSTEILNGRK